VFLQENPFTVHLSLENNGIRSGEEPGCILLWLVLEQWASVMGAVLQKSGNDVYFLLRNNYDVIISAGIWWSGLPLFQSWQTGMFAPLGERADSLGKNAHIFITWTEEIAACFRRTGSECRVVPDLKSARWEKLVLGT
jgi:hypothetical protein